MLPEPVVIAVDMLSIQNEQYSAFWLS